ncbi:GNAT family N-acetyltransferase [Comamonas odontotermitis]|uniref:GNAT family N-acetyltransferase n=1 Tax=Comamonas odontotermitis TaxID=379895 RepID=UPI001CC785A7|nr:GNAT family N-acetyltransferase [Comamonas odontotermitis]UBB16921.1 GNAT family N-acetyltransferase [Comamonas odontotermitis]
MSASLIFRTAHIADLPAIIALLADDALGREREVLANPPDSRYIAAFEAICADSSQRLVVAELQGQVVGTLQLSFVPGLSHTGSWRGQIESVRIAAALRGIGAGQQMLEWAVAQCRERGCSVVQLTTDKSRTDAHRFYQKLGFEPSHLGFKRKL